MRFSVRVPVLSVQITSVEPSVSTALRRLTSAPRRASARTATASASVMTGSSPSGTLPASRPTANTTLFFSDRPAPKIATGTNATAIAHRDPGDQPRDPAHLALQRARLLLDALGQRGDAAELGVHAGREHDALRLPAGGARAAEQEVPRGDPRDARVDELRRAQRRCRLARERREVHLDGARDQAHVGRDPIALLDEHHVAGDQLGGQDRRGLPVAQHPDVLAAGTAPGPPPPARPASPARTRTAR